MQAPRAKKIPKQLSIHGDARIDNYYWLNQKEDQAVIDYLNEENAYTEEKMASTKNLQDKLYHEIIGRIKEDDESVPYFKNEYWYYTRYVKGGEHPIYCRKKGSLDHPEEVMLDVNDLASDHAYYHVAGLSVSPDNRYLAFGEDTLSRRIYTIRIKDLSSNQILDISILKTTGGAAWANDNKTLFYTERDEQTLRSFCIKRFNMETAKTDLVFEEKDETFYCYVGKSKSQEYLVISSDSTLTSEYQYLSANDPYGDFKMFQSRIRGMEYSISHFEGGWYILTNWDAQNFRLMHVDGKATQRDYWKEIIAHRNDTLLEGMELFSEFMVLEERRLGINQLRILDHNTKEDYYLQFNDEAFSCWTGVNPEFNTEVLRYGYTSLTTPNSVFDYNMKTKEQVLLKQQEVVGGYDSSLYSSKRIMAEARDGIKVPISLVYRNDLYTGENPLLEYAYGSYGHSMDPYFSSVRLSLLDRGFVYAIAHIRGGEDLGRAWYEDGKLLQKKNTFYDFIDCAEYLIQEKWVKAGKLYAMGGSAGGLLMGAVINERPDLWNGVIAAVPFVDVVTTMLDDSIPLTTGEYDEWGNPNEEEYYHYIKSYSPYDNVRPQEYPNLLVTTGLHDSQVQYWEPAKWVAKLRELKTGNQLLLLYTNMETGHSGASGRFSAHKETAMEYAFFLMLEDIKE